MFPTRRGFSLIETLIATFILTSGLVAVAWLFVYSAKVTVTNERRTIATFILHEKLEQFKSTPLTDTRWTPGEYSESDGAYLTVWRVTNTHPRTLTVVVYGRVDGLMTRLELAKATTMVAP
jgi:prepilin-type N-terminal cleavage/methylation domain-containing protein